MKWFKRKAAAPQEGPEAEAQEKGGFFSTHLMESSTKPGKLKLRMALASAVKSVVDKLPHAEGASYAMDGADDGIMATKGGMLTAQWGMPDELFAWYASQSFIGHQACAFLAQHWLIDKCCAVPARDAVRNWFEVTSADGEKLRADELKKIERLDKKYKLKKHCHDLVRFGRIFGVRVVMFKVDLGSPQNNEEYYHNPFNLDAVKPGSYKGMVQIDPYWCAPVLDSQDGVQPDSLHFYEPTWWTINGKRVHRSHLVIFINSEVPDILKPSYLYGGVPVPQKVMERVYAAERTANELPLLATSKRQTVLKTDAGWVSQNYDAFVENLQQWITYRDNFQVKVCDKESEDVVQLDTALTDLDNVVMASYQIVAAAANIPATKLLGTTPKGFNATGEYEEASYHEELESIQENDLTELATRHHLMVCKSEGLDLQLSIEWNPIDSPTAKELAEIRKIDAETDAALADTGAIDSYDVRTRLIQDGGSGYTWLEVVERPDEIDLEPEPVVGPGGKGPGQSGQDAFEEGEHPRDKDGQFAKSDSSSSGKARLSPTEKMAINSYSGDDFLLINQKLRAGDEDDPTIKRIDAAIAKNTINSGSKLYRKIDRDAAKKMFGGTINAGQVVSDKAYLSTSSSKNFGSFGNFGGVVLDIEVKKDSPGLSMSGLTRNDIESEVLLPRGSELKVVGITPPKRAGDPVRVRVEYGFDMLETSVMSQDSLEDPSQFLKAFMKGFAVEQEHAATVGGDEETVALIVLDHLAEDIAYYDKLEAIET